MFKGLDSYMLVIVQLKNFYFLATLRLCVKLILPQSILAPLPINPINSISILRGFYFKFFQI